ncbi:MAG: tetratricopeptide repeat protein, partial [Cyclobacteriaceae bacterium]
AEKFYNERAKLAKGNKAKAKFINKAIAKYKACKQSPEVIAGLLRAYEYKGAYTTMTAAKKKLLFEKAVELGENAHSKYPDNLDIAYYYMTNLGRWAQQISLMKAATSGVSTDIKDLAEEIHKKNPHYADAGASRILGVLHMKIPSVPFVISWPSESKGLEYLEWAYKNAPDNPANGIFYAEAMIENGEEEKAKQLLKSISDRQPRPSKLIEDRNNLKRVGELYAEHFDDEISS